MIGLLLLAAAAPANTATDPVQKYMNCVTWKAGDLEPSGEPASSIAEAVAPECDTLLPQAASTVTDEFLSKPDMVEYQKHFPVSRSGLVEANTTQLRKSAIQSAQLLVIELRARRAQATNAQH